MKGVSALRIAVLAVSLSAMAWPSARAHDRAGAFVGGLLAGAVLGAVIEGASNPRPRPTYYYGGPAYAPPGYYAPPAYYAPPPPPAYCGAPPYPPCPRRY